MLDPLNSPRFVAYKDPSMPPIELVHRTTPKALPRSLACNHATVPVTTMYVHVQRPAMYRQNGKIMCLSAKLVKVRHVAFILNSLQKAVNNQDATGISPYLVVVSNEALTCWDDKREPNAIDSPEQVALSQ